MAGLKKKLEERKREEDKVRKLDAKRHQQM